MADASDSESQVIEPDYAPQPAAGVATAEASSAASAATAPADASEPGTTHPDDVVRALPVGPPGEQHGAIVAMTQNGEVKRAFVFVHTPQTVVRDRERGGKGITEMFTIAFEVDAAAALAAGDPTAIAHGIHPELAQLDQLFRENWVMLLYGPSRMIPMTPVAMNVVETAFDDALNPIRAEITFRAERITLTTDLNLGRYVNAAASTTLDLTRLYKPAGLPSVEVS